MVECLPYELYDPQCHVLFEDWNFSKSKSIVFEALKEVTSSLKHPGVVPVKKMGFIWYKPNTTYPISYRPPWMVYGNEEVSRIPQHTDLKLLKTTIPLPKKLILPSKHNLK